MTNLKIKTEVLGDFPMNYNPQVNDYVKWNKNGIIHQGWVYFRDELYITIETFVYPKKDNYARIHKNHHVLLVCHNCYWNELEYVKRRESKYDPP